MIIFEFGCVFFVILVRGFFVMRARLPQHNRDDLNIPSEGCNP